MHIYISVYVYIYICICMDVYINKDIYNLDGREKPRSRRGEDPLLRGRDTGQHVEPPRRLPGRSHHACVRVQGAGFRVQGAGCRVQCAVCSVQCAGCRVQGAVCRVQGAGCRVLQRVADPPKSGWRRAGVPRS